MESIILDFLSDNIVQQQKIHPKIRRLSDLWRKNQIFLETNHNYIQWMFPLDEPSRYNLEAPVLNEKEIELILENKIIQQNILKSLDVMLGFYGFERKGKKIIKNRNFKRRGRNWITKNNHNYLRITRILRSLKITGLGEYADVFYKELMQVCVENPVISDETKHYWKKAVSNVDRLI